MYGQAPPPASVRTAKLSSEGGEEQWRVYVESPTSFEFDIFVAFPESAEPVPALVALNFRGNHSVTSQPLAKIDEDARSGKRGLEADDWSIEETKRAGFALVTAYYQSIEPDDPNATEGIRKVYGPEFSWGAVAAWAWGLSRIFDALVQDPRIDATAVGVTGHSRLGKAALLAAAFDERFAFCAPVQSGCGGAAPSRGTTGESVTQITEQFPHWFAAEFATYGVRIQELPIDQHELMAMLAPRPLLVANAEDDLWANPEGQLEALDEAGELYRFFGVYEGTATYSRPGGHHMGRPDWDAVREFARKAL